MANSGPSSSAPGYSKSSRFSTLKMFKINSKDRPPPPPPKDPYYLQNKSMTSLSPDCYSIPPQSPLFPHYISQFPDRRSPVPSQSNMSLISSAASQVSMTPTDKLTPKKKKSLNFLKFGRRSKSSLRDTETDFPIPHMPTRDDIDDFGDPGITMPSNFQHHIHVDDSLAGLPPSWSKSLAERGFTEEEIAVINIKRAANSRPIQQIYNSRPESPITNYAPSINQSYNTTINDRSISPAVSNLHSSPVLTNPTPRTSSLARKFSNASTHGGRLSMSTNVPVPAVFASSSTTSLQSGRTDGSVSGETPSLHNPSVSVGTASSDSHSSTHATGHERLASPITPTRQMVSPISPPPAYRATMVPAYQDVKPDLPPTVADPASALATAPSAPPVVSLPIPPSSHRPQPSDDSAVWTRSVKSYELSSTPQVHNGSLSRAPRLSLHANNDSDDWSKLVLSVGSLRDDPPASTFKAGQPVAAGPPLRPIPPIIVPEVETESSMDSAFEPSSSYAEASLTARYPPTSSSSSPPVTSSSWKEFSNDMDDFNFVEKEDLKEPPLSAALSGSYSPVLPHDLVRSSNRDTLRPGPDGTLLKPPQQRHSREEYDDDDDDDDFLSVRRSNRDSSRSSSSTISASTVTGYTYATSQVIRSASIVRRTGAAYVTTAPASFSARNKGKPQLSPQYPQSPLQKSFALMQTLAESPGADIPPLSPMGVTFEANGDSSSSPGSIGQSVALPSPLTSQFGSDESTGSTSTSSGSQSRGQPTPTTDPGSGGLEVVVEADIPSHCADLERPTSAVYEHIKSSARDTFGVTPNLSAREKTTVSGNVKDNVVDSYADSGNDAGQEGKVLHGEGKDGKGAEGEDDEEGTWDTVRGNAAVAALNASMAQPTIVISGELTLSPPTHSGGSSSSPQTPLTPVQRYPGWLSGVVEPLAPYIDDTIEPREHYSDLQEIAEGESGSVFAARVVASNAKKLRLPPNVKQNDTAEIEKGNPALVAVKVIAITPPSSSANLPEAQKLIDLEKELKLMKGLWHDNILGLDALYVDSTEDTLWVRMELMERSLADIIGLVVDGLVLHDRMIARFAQDVLHGLEYLQGNRIAHRDVRSDNLLLNSHGVLKLTDFSNAVRLPIETSLRSDPAGVIFWQAPEMRSPNYDALKVDVWSLGATIWEMAETEPPFSDTKQAQSRLPPLTRPEMWSPTFHSFLRACSEPAHHRKGPIELLKDPFVNNVCGRGVIVQLLSQCMNIERMIQPIGES